MKIIYIFQIIANSLIFLKAVFRLFQQALIRGAQKQLRPPTFARGLLVYSLMLLYLIASESAVINSVGISFISLP
jgi:hypothetical protein